MDDAGWSDRLHTVRWPTLSRRRLARSSRFRLDNESPQASGAQVGYPARQVVAMSGDGGIAMLLGDLLTLRQLNLPVKIVVFNNASLAFVQLEMRAAGFLDRGVALTDPDFARI